MYYIEKESHIYIIRNILLPTDFSDCSAAAFEHASTFAVMYNAHLHVLHVAKEPQLNSSNPEVAGLESLQSSNGPTPQDELRRLVERMLPDQTKVIEAVKFGQPYKEIVNYARHEDIDLIVIGTHGRTGLTHLVMGSVAEKVVRFSPVPVLTVKPSRLDHSISPESHFLQEISDEKFNEYSG